MSTSQFAATLGALSSERGETGMLTRALRQRPEAHGRLGPSRLASEASFGIMELSPYGNLPMSPQRLVAPTILSETRTGMLELRRAPPLIEVVSQPSIRCNGTQSTGPVLHQSSSPVSSFPCKVEDDRGRWGNMCSRSMAIYVHASSARTSARSLECTSRQPGLRHLSPRRQSLIVSLCCQPSDPQTPPPPPPGGGASSFAGWLTTPESTKSWVNMACTPYKVREISGPMHLGLSLNRLLRSRECLPQRVWYRTGAGLRGVSRWVSGYATDELDEQAEPPPPPPELS
ncbi:hypothetical protein LY76DRAFT_405194 [Colletotrichum caudatum]|nr:hypothetical protein LY76DRAFT_405194 [Colletotrichum caudatum]